MSRQALLQQRRLLKLKSTNPSSLLPVALKTESIQNDEKPGKPHGHKCLWWHWWDGRPWNVMDFKACSQSPYEKQRMATEAELADVQKRLDSSNSPYAFDYYMRDHLTARLRVFKDLGPIYKACYELDMLCSLLQRAPDPLFHRFQDSWVSLSEDCFAFKTTVRALQRTKLHHAYHAINPIYYRMVVNKSNILWSPRADSANAANMRRKSARLQRKLAARLSLDDQVTQRQEQVGFTWEEEYHLHSTKQPIDGSWDRWLDLNMPQAWAVDGFVQAIRATMDPFESLCIYAIKDLKVWSWTSPTPTFWDRSSPFQVVLQHLIKDIRDLYDLNTLLTHLRYYRLYRYPDVDLTSDIRAGRALARYSRQIEGKAESARQGWRKMVERDMARARSSNPVTPGNEVGGMLTERKEEVHHQHLQLPQEKHQPPTVNTARPVEKSPPSPKHRNNVKERPHKGQRKGPLSKPKRASTQSSKPSPST